jgi:septum formation protein
VLRLASTSAARRALLGSLGVDFVAEAPGVDEDVPAGMSVAEAVVLLARRKAEAVAARWPGDVVLGADQLVSLDGEALGKASNPEEALRQLKRVAGRTHDILTGVALVGPGVDETALDVARLTVAPLGDDALRAYVATGEWEGCAGSYRVEGQGQWLFTAIEGDRTSVQGLPLLVVTRLLRQAGLAPW